MLANVAETRSTWQVNHIRAEAQRLLRYLDHPGGPEVVNRIVTTALGEHSIALTTHADTEMGEPVALRRRDGESVYTGHDTTVYTSAPVMAAERRILAAAAKGGGRVVDDTSIGLALLEAHAQHGFELNDGQQQLVKTMATSGARLQLALAPAGTGKTTAMGALAAAWANSGGNVIGLAPTASAAEVLGRRHRRHHRHHGQIRSARRTRRPALRTPARPRRSRPQMVHDHRRRTRCSSSTKPAKRPPSTLTPSSATRWRAEPACAWSATTNNWPPSRPAG